MDPTLGPRDHLLTEQPNEACSDLDVLMTLEAFDLLNAEDAGVAAAVAAARDEIARAAEDLQVAPWSVKPSAKALALAKIGAEYVLRWLPRGTHDWRKFVRPSELAAGLKSGGADITELKGMSYDPIGDEWRLSGDLAVNYLAFAVKR